MGAYVCFCMHWGWSMCVGVHARLMSGVIPKPSFSLNPENTDMASFATQRVGNHASTALLGIWTL